MLNFFRKEHKSFVGIDIGTAGIRLVQLGKEKNVIRLENYASIETKNHLNILGGINSKFDNIGISIGRIVEDLKKIIKEAGIDSKKVIMSVPTSTVFSSIISLPKVSAKEIGKVIDFEARKYIPVPIKEVVFDWIIINGNGKDLGNTKDAKHQKKTRVLLVAIPKRIADEYASIVKKIGLDLISLETESFSLARSLVGDEDGSFTIVDIGSKMTGITIVENGFILASHSISGAGGEEITKVINHGFNVDLDRAEDIKMRSGFRFSSPEEKKVSEIILPIASIIISEIKRINNSYTYNNKKRIKKIIIVGGSAKLHGFVNYISKKLNVPVNTGNPWKTIAYDKILSEKLEQSSVCFSVAVGLALKGFEK